MYGFLLRSALRTLPRSNHFHITSSSPFFVLPACAELGRLIQSLGSGGWRVLSLPPPWLPVSPSCHPKRGPCPGWLPGDTHEPSHTHRGRVTRAAATWVRTKIWREFPPPRSSATGCESGTLARFEKWRGKRVKRTQPGGITATHPALECVRGAGRAQQLLELQGAVGHEVVIAQGRLVEDGQFEVATVGNVGAELLIVRGFVGLLFGAGLAHAHLVHAHRQVGVQQLVALLEERVAQGPAGGLQPHSLANTDPQVTIELHGAGRHAGAAARAPGGRAGSQRESLEPRLKPALAAAAGVEAAPGKSSAQALLEWSFCLLPGTFPSPPSLAPSPARWKGGEPGAEPSASRGSPTVPLQRAALPGGSQRIRPFSRAGKLLSSESRSDPSG